MTRNHSVRAAMAASWVALFALPFAVRGDPKDKDETLKAHLIGYTEVPVTASAGSGTFNARVAEDELSFTWELSYTGVPAITQSHIHIAQKNVNGGIVIWLCANNPPITNAPPGTKACPPGAGTVTGTATAANVTAVATQQIAAGDWAKVLDAIRSGFAYANIHSVTSPGGEIRGQVKDKDD